MMSLKYSFLFLLPILFSTGNGETIQSVMVRTADCWNCGMIEDVGQLDIKICGDISCCFIQHLDNSETNFRPGDEDVFTGAGGLLECFNYEVNPRVCRRVKSIWLFWFFMCRSEMQI